MLEHCNTGNISYHGKPTNDVTGWNLGDYSLKLINTAEYEHIQIISASNIRLHTSGRGSVYSESDGGFACQPMTVSQKVQLSSRWTHYDTALLSALSFPEG